ncbi:MAG: CHRD domain-containing protein [Cyanobacteria bacterium P01_H01_bin.58]
MLKLIWQRGIAIAVTGTAVAFTADASQAATLFQAELDGLQVVSPNFPSGVPTTASGLATFTLSADQTQLEYTIQLDGLNLKETDRTAAEDVTKIHIHTGAVGVNGPHVLNIFGAPSEDDGDLFVDYDNEFISGIWDDSDAIDPLTGNLFDPTVGSNTKQLSSFVDELLAGELYLQVHTVAFDTPLAPGELRGQISATIPEPSAVLGVVLVTGGLLASRKSRPES